MWIDWKAGRALSIGIEMAIQQLIFKVSEVEAEWLDYLENYDFGGEKTQKGSILPSADSIVPFIFPINSILLGNQMLLEKMQTGHIPTEFLFH